MTDTLAKKIGAKLPGAIIIDSGFDDLGYIVTADDIVLHSMSNGVFCLSRKHLPALLRALSELVEVLPYFTESGTGPIYTM